MRTPLPTTCNSTNPGRLLPKTEFLDRPWRIHEIADDFDLLDVWQLPTPGGRHDLGRVAEILAEGDFEHGDSPIVRAVWAVRWELGKLFKWDDPQNGVGIRVPSLSARLPADLLDAPIGPDFAHLPFTSLFLLPDEFAAELANSTCHGVLHLGWVETESGCYTAQLTVLAKPNGTRGRLYLTGIQPFRYALIYPALLRRIERSWAALENG